VHNDIGGSPKHQEYSRETLQCKDGRYRDFRVLRVLDLPGQITCVPGRFIKLKTLDGRWVEIERCHPCQMRHLDDAYIEAVAGVRATRKLGPDVYLEVPCCS
jgi:hypothetical protein